MDNKKSTKNILENNIIEVFQISKLPEDKQEEVINRIGSIIFQSVLLKVLPMLKEEELSEYEKLLEQKPEPEAVLDFFFEKIPSFLQIMAKETENFAKESAKALK